MKALLASLAIVAFIQTASPVMAAPAHTFYVLSENRSPRPRAVWSAWRSPGELVWSMATDCQLRNSVALSSGEAIVTAHCPVSTEWKGRKAYVYKPIAIKLDTAGHPIWSKRLDIEGFTELYGLRPAPNGTFFASGVRELCAGSDACRESFFVNFNSAGQMIQAKLLKSKDDDKGEWLDEFRVTEEGDLIGVSTSGLWRIDADGMPRWVRSHWIKGERRWLKVLAVEKGIIVAVTHSIISEAEDAKIIVLAHDLDGNLLWSREVYAGPSDEIYSAAIDDTGIIHLVGSAVRMGATLEDRVFPRAGWIVQMSAAGELLSSATVSPHLGTLLTGVETSPQGPVVKGKVEVKQILTFGMTSRECTELWPIPTSISSVEVKAEAGELGGSFQDLKFDMPDFPFRPEMLGPSFEIPCPGSIAISARP